MVGSRPKVWTRDERSSAKDGGEPERLRCGTIQEESPAMMTAGTARKISLSILPCIL